MPETSVKPPDYTSVSIEGYGALLNFSMKRFLEALAVHRESSEIIVVFSNAQRDWVRLPNGGWISARYIEYLNQPLSTSV
ncbi:hypothetical protein BST81_01500 [Leptolyngbya sp. 'hensonii']|uniref:hypothetical protein n=1 Tax=Leptolyngbya sp. 'hensonii' TaxID=1922337 RepID=UPI00094F852E|nr:hypothetical protein [Leptolyngbya sp. 'hensonii']OLP20137.1 hypothetical protein BST81_01500 [Leptolyngbya sp. 'hensonii']